MLLTLTWVTDANELIVGDGQSPASCNYSSLSDGLASLYADKVQQIEVVFNCGSKPVTILFNDHIFLYGLVTIDGANLITLDGGGQYRQFVIGSPVKHGTFRGVTGVGTVVNLQNLAFANGVGNTLVISRRDPSGAPSPHETVGKRDGGCIYASGESAINLNNVLFENCTTVGDYVPDPDNLGNAVTFLGGAIFSEAYVSLTANNTSFINNTAGDNYKFKFRLLIRFRTIIGQD